MRKFIQLISVLSVFLFSCQEETFDPSESFTKIYDSFRSDHGYNPIDLAPTASGYLVLAGQSAVESDFMGVQIFKLDEEGTYESAINLSLDYLNPIGDLMQLDSNYYFFAMEPITLRTVLIRTDHEATDFTAMQTGLTYPLAAASTANGNFLLLSYNPEDQQSIITTLDKEANLIRSAAYSIGAGSDAEPHIYNHLVDPYRYALPFFCGELPDGTVYFNGLFNYSLSLVFTNFGEDPTGVVQGQAINGGISAATPLPNGDFSIFGFQFNDSFIQSAVSINTNGISSSVDLFHSSISEFKARTPAKILNYTVNEIDYSLIAAETENRQVALYFYDAHSGELKAIHKLGYINPYTLASIKIDSENNLLVAGTTYVSGRFERMYVSKLSEDQVADVIF